MDALGTVVSWDTNGILILAWMFGDGCSLSPYTLGIMTQTESWVLDMEFLETRMES